MATLKQMRQSPIKLKAVFITAISLVWMFGLIAIGHIVMVIVNKNYPEFKWEFAILNGVIGFLIILATRFIKTDGWQSFCGVLGASGLWICFEYTLIYAAERMGVSYTYNGTYPEYRLMKWSLGLLLMVTMYLLFQESVRCNFLCYLRKKLHLMRGVLATGRIDNYGPRTAFEYIMTTWFFYVLVLVAYDEQMFGARGKLTYAIFYCCFAIAFYLAYKLLNYDRFGPNIRFAIPTVMVFWNSIEILAKWGMLKEPWVHINWPIMFAIISGFVISTYLIYRDMQARKAEAEARAVAKAQEDMTTI